MRLSDLGELALIERLARKAAGGAGTPDGASPEPGARPAAPARVALGIGDDAALLDLPAGMELVATIDALVEEVHFRREWARPEDLGWKALAVNVSDVGAMGGRPVGALVSLALPPELPVRWVERLYDGLAACAAAYGCPIVGGDTVRSPERIALAVAALGGAPEGRAVRRSGARPGDWICVTGVLGESAAGLALLERARAGGPPPGRRYLRLVRAHLRPCPPVFAGAALAERGLPTAMLDLSDGIALDLNRIARSSGIAARIDSRRLPISDLARRAAEELGADPLHWALHGGEDYQLLFTLPPERFPEAPPLLAPLGVTATVIGEVRPPVGRRRAAVEYLDAEGRPRPLRPLGFAHFEEAPSA